MNNFIINRLRNMRNLLNRNAFWIDLYNQCTNEEISGTILTTIDSSNNFYTMAIKPINTMPDGVSRTIKRQYQQTSKANLVRQDSLAATGVVQQIPINGNSDGTASALTGAHFYSGHITEPKGGHKENGVIEIEDYIYRIRKFTPKECFRLMGVSDADIDTLLHSGISNSQLYKLAGNSIVVNCLAAIFRQLLIENSNKNQQLEIF